MFDTVIIFLPTLLSQYCIINNVLYERIQNLLAECSDNILSPTVVVGNENCLKQTKQDIKFPNFVLNITDQYCDLNILLVANPHSTVTVTFVIDLCSTRETIQQLCS